MDAYCFPGSFTIIYRLIVSYQFPLPLTRHRFDGAFPFHGGDSIRLELKIDQFDREPAAGIFGGVPGVVTLNPFFGVIGPAGVVGPISTFEDITIGGHGNILYHKQRPF